MRISALNETARTGGLREGQGVAEARAICPALDVVPADPEADRRMIEALADWADRYTPLVALDLPDGLFLDISGCDHLFGGERALLTECLGRLSELGFEARGAVAPTPGLAWALARYGSSGCVAGFEDMAKLLPPLPVASLRLPFDTVAALYRLGLKRVGDLLTAPRAPLTRRFGPELMVRLDRLTGRLAEPISPRRPVAEVMVERRLAEPVTALETIETITGHLARSLRETLARRGCGLREAELSLFRVDGVVRRIRVGTARPLRDPDRLQRLFAERLAGLHDEIDAGYGFEIIRLAAPVLAELADDQADFAGNGEEVIALHALADRIAARLGADRVLVPEGRDSHLPERALAHIPHGAARTATGEAVPLLPPYGAARPLRLFRHPEPVTAVAEAPEGPPFTFRWRNSHLRVLRAEGPERIAAEWWLAGEAAPARDYYRVEDEAGRRYWLFREGLYERDPGHPRWFMHGLLA